MTQAQQVFEAMMVAKGYTDFNKIKDRYINPSVQTRWNYFILGWQLRGVQWISLRMYLIGKMALPQSGQGTRNSGCFLRAEHGVKLYGLKWNLNLSSKLMFIQGLDWVNDSWDKNLLQQTEWSTWKQGNHCRYGRSLVMWEVWWGDLIRTPDP